jgi:hypothetical protein
VKAAAKPRVIEGRTYPDPISFCVSYGFDAAQCREVTNAYKAYYSKGKPAGHWLTYVTNTTDVKDEVMATAIIRAYRRFYGK